MTNQSMPRVLSGNVAKLWQQMYDQARQAGIDPVTTALVVTDPGQRRAVESLVALGGATSVETPEGLSVQLIFDQPGQDNNPMGVNPSRAAAARPTSFA